jgi:hypothetical protein
MAALTPTVFILDTPYQDDIPERGRSRSPSPSSLVADDSENHEEELYGLALLRRIISESYVRNASKLVVTIPIIAAPYGDHFGGDGGTSGTVPLGSPDDSRAANKRMLRKCLDLGATDVMTSPMNAKCVTNLEVHAYRAHLDAARDKKALVELRRGRKRSWVGICEEKPFSYLREAMVSKLMGRICRIGSETDEVACSIRLSITAEKQAEVTSAVGQWHFCAHDFTEDELVVAALVMFKHALSMPELEPWRIPTGMSAVIIHKLPSCSPLTPSPRSATPLSSRVPGRLQHVRPISQLSPRGRCPAGDLPLPRQHRLSASLSLGRRRAIRGLSQVANCRASTTV